MTGASLNGMLSPQQKAEVEDFVKSTNISRKKQRTTVSIVNSDRRILKIIESAFSELSIRGKGVCAEWMVRELAKEASGQK